MRRSKAAEANILLEAFFNTKAEKLRAEYVLLLDLLWPGVRCRYEEGRVLVFYARSKVGQAPPTLFRAASYVEEVLDDGSAVVLKDDLLGPRRIAAATIPMYRLTAESMPRPPISFWHRLGEDED